MEVVGAVNLLTNKKIYVMTKFYVLMSVLIIIAIINLIRALKETNLKGKVIGVTTNVVAIALLATALLIDLLQL